MTKVKTPMPEWLERQLRIAEETVSTWSEEKQVRFANRETKKTMTNWKDKYKDLEVDQTAWYWHKEKNESWKIIEVYCITSMPDGYKIIRIASSPFGCVSLISKNFPNGPKCLTPDDVIELAEELVELGKVLDGTINPSPIDNGVGHG